MPKFQKGDVLDVIAYDQGDEVWERGTILITGHDPKAKHTKEGIYSVQPLKGQIRWISINSQIFDEGVEYNTNGPTPMYMANIYRNLLTNIGSSTTIDILYGKNS